MADFEIKVEGADQLRAKFESLRLNMKDVLAEATAAGASVVEREAKLNSRRGGDEYPHRITGNLFDSIKSLKVLSTDERCEYTVGSSMVYARRLEYGFVDTDKRGRKYNQHPRPFLRPALDENKSRINAAFGSKVKRIIDKSLGGL